MTLVTQIVPLESQLPQVEFQWDFDTEILTGSFPASSAPPQRSCTIEVGGAGGSFVTLVLDGPVLAAIEVAVWPQNETVTELGPPQPQRLGRLEVHPDPEVQAAGMMELKGPLACEKNSDRSTIHLMLGESRDAEPVTLAENLLVEVDSSGRLAGFWLLSVPPFPTAVRHK